MLFSPDFTNLFMVSISGLLGLKDCGFFLGETERQERTIHEAKAMSTVERGNSSNCDIQSSFEASFQKAKRSTYMFKTLPKEGDKTDTLGTSIEIARLLWYII